MSWHPKFDAMYPSIREERTMTAIDRERPLTKPGLLMKPGQTAPALRKVHDHMPEPRYVRKFFFATFEQIISKPRYIWLIDVSWMNF